jgi:hypothetical protein
MIQEINSFIRGFRVQLLKWNLFPKSKRTDIFFRSSRGNSVEFINSRCTEDIKDELKLVMAIISFLSHRTEGSTH